jgi:hypothetical protein
LPSLPSVILWLMPPPNWWKYPLLPLNSKIPNKWAKHLICSHANEPVICNFIYLIICCLY